MLVMRPGTRGDDRQLVASKLERPEMKRVLSVYVTVNSRK